MTLAARALGIGLLLAAPSLARADVISMEEAVCRDANENDACDLGDQPGLCVKSTCSKNDYSEGAPPKVVSVDCLICDPKAKPPAPEEAKASADAEGKSEREVSAKAEAKPATPAGGGSCSVDGSAPVGLGLVLLGLAAWARRRD